MRTPWWLAVNRAKITTDDGDELIAVRWELSPQRCWASIVIWNGDDCVSHEAEGKGLRSSTSLGYHEMIETIISAGNLALNYGVMESGERIEGDVHETLVCHLDELMRDLKSREVK
jgi:hypothetical protein